MSLVRELGQIEFLLESGEWHEVSKAITLLKKKGKLLRKADEAFMKQFESAERKRQEVFKKRFLISGLCLCQVHWSYNTGANDILPISQIRIVSCEENTLLICQDCIGKLTPSYSPRTDRTVGEIPKPEEAWKMIKERDMRLIAMYMKMPSLRDFVEVCEAHKKARRYN